MTPAIYQLQKMQKVHRQYQPPDRFPVEHLIHSQQDQRQHVDAIQPHNIAALRNLVLHQTIAHGKCDHKYRPDPVVKTTLQIPAEGRPGCRQLQGTATSKNR